MIVSVFVTYEPKDYLMNESINSLSDQVDLVVVIDNSPISSVKEKIDCRKVLIVELNENIGIAAAQNIGIKKALELKADYVILSDQDTIYPSDYVHSMLPVFDIHPNACVVVPKFVDANKKSADGFIKNAPIFFKQFYPQTGLHPLLQAISSGKILKVSSLEKIGLMDELLFIDWVDLEWCWRARSKGFEIIGNADVTIQHQLGDSSKNLGFREVNLRSPMRHYYITRNAFYLSLYSTELDLLHRVNLFFKSFRYIFAFPILSKPHVKNLSAVSIGFWHGVTRRLGKYDL